MATEIIRIGNYSVNYVSATRVKIQYEGEQVCKYDRTTDGIKELLADLIDFLVEDKIIKRKDEDATKATIKNAILAFTC